ncbi:uncharacterized protein [Centruroides vittatus]|uniref:uncharacterized protein n=1 Tax=Centruroides vittatus TaxID=120091 RepID=UPI00350FE3E0
MLKRIYLICLLLIPVKLQENEEQCEPSFADDCFGDIEKTLRDMLDVKNNVAKRVTYNSLDEFCWVLDDALNCTSDIIDSDCSSDEGRDQFDSWLEALRAAYFYVCGGDSLEDLSEIFRGIACWNIDIFVNCTIAKLRIGHVEDLLYTNLDFSECTKLRQSFFQCNQMAKVSSCREQNNVEDKVHELLTTFLDASHCSGQSVINSFKYLIILCVWYAYLKRLG